MLVHLLLCSNWFAPSVGGVETVSKILAEEFTRAGHRVTVVTATSPGPSATEMGAPYEIVRNPSQRELFRLANSADALMQNLISLRTLPILLLTRKPVVVIHNSWLRRNDGSRGLENYLKLLALRFCHNISVSTVIADSLPVPSEIIGNPFEADEFAPLHSTPKDRDIVFMGRLVSDKGCDLLLHAVVELRRTHGLRPSVTIIGDGPEMPSLRSLVEQFQLGSQVEFRGALREHRGEVVARHRIMAIPSVWDEPFGVVALEGIASGCAIVASERGGLPEAGGPAGLYFQNRDVNAMAMHLKTLLTDDVLCRRMATAGLVHLQRFRPSTIAGRYLDIFRQLHSRQHLQMV